MHHPGEDNVPLMRTHQELVSYDNVEDDTYNTVVETLVEKLSHILTAPTAEDGKDLGAQPVRYLHLLGLAEPVAQISQTQAGQAQSSHPLALVSRSSQDID